MRQIACDCCGGTGHYIIFDSTTICDTCRLSVINCWIHRWGFSFESHPFINQFIVMDRPRAIVRVNNKLKDSA